MNFKKMLSSLKGDRSSKSLRKSGNKDIDRVRESGLPVNAYGMDLEPFFIDPPPKRTRVFIVGSKIPLKENSLVKVKTAYICKLF